MKPLKVAFLWHMHQPNYEYEGEYLLPWVRLHSIKDYLDFPSLLYRYPNVKFNFNYVPSLLEQLENLLSGKIEDRVIKLSRINPTHLNHEQKNEIINTFFIANYENMIKPYPDYDILHYKAKNKEEFSNQDILDLQVWYNLTWSGIITKTEIFFDRLIKKGRNFTLEERDLLLKKQLSKTKKIIDNLKDLIKINQLEVSFSPFNHPILPLLNNINSANEKLDLQLNTINFKFQNDSKFQIQSSKDLYEDYFGHYAKGIWPSEGSISNLTLNQFIDAGYNWTATDEQILKDSDPKFYDLDKYFPRKYESKSGHISIFFRDHRLSDKIGFTYTSWDAVKAVEDFFFDLHDIRNKIIDKYGEYALDYACVSIILDGENCWEFYPRLGLDFRSRLLQRLNDDDYFKTVTMQEAADKNSFLLPLSKVKAGSWINGNFRIWIGEQIHHKAWKLLADIRNHIEINKNKIEIKNFKKTMKYLYRAESSDWFWWYFSEHHAPNKYDFDKLFRKNLEKALNFSGLNHSFDLSKSLWDKFKENDDASPKFGTMHQVSS